MKVNVQLHILAALGRKKRPNYPLNRRSNGTQIRCGRLCVETQFLCCQAHNQVTTLTTQNWRSWRRASLVYSFKYNQRDATLYNILYCCQCSTCFRRFYRPSSGAQTVHTVANSPTLAVAASKLDIYQMLYVQFELLMMGGKTAWNM